MKRVAFQDDFALLTHHNIRKSSGSTRYYWEMALKSFREELWFETKKKKEFVNITPKVEAILARSGIGDGFCLVNAMHITASVFINDDEQGLLKDFEDFLL